jgi:hypothetical protein
MLKTIPNIVKQITAAAAITNCAAPNGGDILLATLVY